jgi:hypothetical protein
MPLALESFDLRGYDLLVSSESGPAKGILAPSGACHFCYVHSPCATSGTSTPLTSPSPDAGKFQPARHPLASRCGDRYLSHIRDGLRGQVLPELPCLYFRADSLPQGYLPSAC